MTNIVKRNNEIFPAVFGWNAFDKLFENMFSADLFETPQGYPTDLIEVKDEAGNVTGYEVAITLAGIPKENVVVTVENDAIDISINKVEKSEDKKRNYLHKGISQRSMQLRYGLHGVDKDKIKASLTDGMLKVELPLAEEVKPRTIAIS